MIQKASIFGLALVGSLVSVPAAGQKEPEKPKVLEQVGLFYLPNARQPRTMTVKAKEDILTRNLVWGVSAKPDKNIRLKTREGQATIKAGTVLPAVWISGLQGESGQTLAFCTVVEKKMPENKMSILGILLPKVINSLTDGRTCIYDKNQDGSADFGFLVGTGERADRVPKAIAPANLNVANLRPVDGYNSVSITLLKSSRPKFRIDIEQYGKYVKFDTIKHGNGMEEPRVQKLSKETVYPYEAEIFGARFTILDHDKKTGAIKIEWPEGYEDRMINVPTDVEFVYRYY